MARNRLIAMALLALLAACSSDRSESITHIQELSRPPATPPTFRPEPEFEWQRQGDRVFFDYDQSTLKPEGRDQLRRWVTFLNKYRKDKLVIEGHADERGTHEYNLPLGVRRANSVKQFLIAQGVDPSRLSTNSYGNERPAVLGSNEAAWAQNRRAVGVIR